MRVELMLVGDELLTGDLDPYPAGMLKAIRGKGAVVSQIAVVPDEQMCIVRELDASCARGTGLLVVTGGLGPTIDDVTRHALASFLGAELVVDERARGWVRDAYLARHGRAPDQGSPAMLMAMVPEGTEALRNPAGIACGIRAVVEGTTIVCLPGFPREMLAMFELHVLPLLGDEGVYEREMRVMHGETAMEPVFQQVAREFKVRIASLPKEGWHEKGGNVVVIKGRREDVEKACLRFLQLMEGFDA
ncbi:MAG: molybdopterin-binding protein [Methanomassiliicoccales archaeon]|jgi:nicotinamide-nucleotide amidase|nr:molybdopterin-binding protein [Methanomassiliicoccales archaeon]